MYFHIQPSWTMNVQNDKLGRLDGFRRELSLRTHLVLG